MTVAAQRKSCKAPLPGANDSAHAAIAEPTNEAAGPPKATSAAVPEQQQERSPHAELARELHRVACGPVLDDLAVFEAANHDAA